MTALAVKGGRRRSLQRTDGAFNNIHFDPKRGRRRYESRQAEYRRFQAIVVAGLSMSAAMLPVALGPGIASIAS
jgi:hypothetical protein